MEKKVNFREAKLGIVFLAVLMFLFLASSVFGAIVTTEEDNDLVAEVDRDFDIMFTITSNQSVEETVSIDILIKDKWEDEIDFDWIRDVTVQPGQTIEYEVNVDPEEDGDYDFTILFDGPYTDLDFAFDLEVYEEGEILEFDPELVDICYDTKTIEIELDDLGDFSDDEVDLEIEDDAGLDVDFEDKDDVEDIEEGDEFELEFDNLYGMPVGEYEIQILAETDTGRELTGFITIRLNDCYESPYTGQYDSYATGYPPAYPYSDSYRTYYGTTYTGQYGAGLFWFISGEEFSIDVPPMVEGEEGESVFFQFTVRNLGQRRTIIELSSDYPLFGVDQRNIDIYPGQRKIVTANLVMPKANERDLIVITGRTSTGKTKRTTIALRAFSKEALDFSILNTRTRYYAGDVFNLNLKLKNKDPITKAYNIQISSSPGLEISQRTYSVTLASQEEETLSIPVTITENAPQNSRIGVVADGKSREYVFSVVSAAGVAANKIKILSIPEKIDFESSEGMLSITLENLDLSNPQTYTLEIFEGERKLVRVEGNIEAGDVAGVDIPLKLSAGTHNMKIKITNNNQSIEKGVRIKVPGVNLAGLLTLGGAGDFTLALVILAIGLLVIYFTTGGRLVARKEEALKG